MKFTYYVLVTYFVQYFNTIPGNGKICPKNPVDFNITNVRAINCSSPNRITVLNLPLPIIKNVNYNT